MSTLTALGRCVAVGVLMLAFARAAWPAPPPTESYTRDPAIRDVVPSPSGKRMAMLVLTDTGRYAAAVLNLPIQGQPKAVAAFGDADVVSVHWVNDDRLVYTALRRGARIFSGDGGTFAIDHDGGRERQLIAWRDDIPTTGTRIPLKLLPYGWFFNQTVDDGSADIIVEQHFHTRAGEPLGTLIARLNTLDGSLNTLSRGAPESASEWVFDTKGELRVARELHDGHDRLLMREGASDRWTTLEDVPDHGDTGLTPMFMEGDDQLIVRAFAGRNTSGLYTYQLSTRKLDPEPLMVLDRFNAGSVQTDRQTHHAVGVNVLAERPVGVWFTARLAGIQKAVDTALPARFNTVYCGRCESSSSYVVWSRSDRQPGEYYVFDFARRALTRLAPTRPWIDENTQGRRSFHWVSARDGLQIPVVVTHPPGRGDREALPAVVVVHGGPWLRGSDLRWESEAQFLASRGYRVIEPDFRGSLGYGWKLFRAGWKQWGLAMEDDLADALAWAGQQGLVDLQRVCIYGASYGGYAALMGPITHPGLYRCAASFAGVTDIELMYTSAWGDFSDQSKRYSMPTLIGDPEADVEQLRRTSPIRRVAEIKVPVLLAQGTLDRRVPREHADKFESAARTAGVPIERITYTDEGHGWFEQADHTDFLNRLEQFLAKSLGR